jgi:DDE superfamily endonuclease/Helix-turn-helix of DDE superfamily endonuclease
MIFRYETLSKHPAIFQNCTGLRLAEFESLATDVLPRLLQARQARLERAERKRAIGAGAPAQLSFGDQLLMTVIWLRRYPNNEGLGYFFKVSDSTASRVVNFGLPHLEESGRDTFRQTDPGRKHRRTLPELLAAMPKLSVLVDSFEQRVQRPNDGSQKEYFSGKKKCHTLKTQITVCAQTGLIVDVSESVAGPTADSKLFEQSGVLKRLPSQTAYGGDLGYQGLSKVVPTGQGFTPHRKKRGQERTSEEIAYNRDFASWRVEVEPKIERMRNYKSLSQTDRPHRQRPTSRTVAVAGLANRQMVARRVA